MVCLAAQKVSFLVITELNFDTLFSPRLNPRYLREWKGMLHQKFVTIREGGLVQCTWNEIFKSSMEDDILKEIKRNMPEMNAMRQWIFFNSQLDASNEHSNCRQCRKGWISRWTNTRTKTRMPRKHNRKRLTTCLSSISSKNTQSKILEATHDYCCQSDTLQRSIPTPHCCCWVVALIVSILDRQFGFATKTYKKYRNRRVDVVDNSDDTLAIKDDQTTLTLSKVGTVIDTLWVVCLFATWHIVR